MAVPLWKKERFYRYAAGQLRKLPRKELPVADRKRPRSVAGFEANDMGHDYTPAEIEFMLAMDRYKRDRFRPYPDCRDILAVVHQLGYRKQEVAHDAAPDAQ